MKYIQTPKTITYKDLTEKCSFSPSSYRTLLFKNKTVRKVRELLSEKPQRGQEVGSFSYTNKSNFYFIRTKALQTPCFLPVVNDAEYAVPILPMVFKDFKLRKGDILISKDANIGESAYLDQDLPNFMICGGIVRLRFNDSIKYYVFAFMKDVFFRSQIESMVSRAATIKHAKTLWLDAIIPFPNQQSGNQIVQFVSLLAKAAIRKEAEIKRKYNTVIELVNKELKENQKPNRFIYSMPSFTELQKTGRLDASIYSLDFKKRIFYVENYKKGATKLKNLGFEPRRGPNLAVSVIGRSVYREEARSNFYTLIEPIDITDFMTIRRLRWLGNKTKIPHLRKGDVLFGAEGSIGKVYIFCEDIGNTITNYHGMAINTDKIDLVQNVFLGCFLSFLKEQGIFDNISVGGQGGSVGKEKLESLHIPNFPSAKKEEIAKYYYNPTNYNENRLNVTDFEDEDIRVVTESGIW